MERTRVAIILAAGVGSRLRPLTDDRPKALVDIGGESIVGRAVRLLASYGVQKVVLATGYREDALREALRGAPVEVVCRRNPEYETTQNSVSLALCAKDVLGQDFFKLDGDVVFVRGVLERLDRAPAALSAAIDRRGALDEEAMKVRIDARGGILAFGKQIDLAASHGESIGIERLRADAGEAVFAELERAQAAGRRDLYYEDVYNQAIERGVAAAAVDVSDLPWAEVDTLEDLERARALSAARAER